MTSADGEQVADLAEGGYLDHRYDAGGILPVSLGLAVNDTGHPERVLTAEQLDAELAKADAAAKTPVPLGEPCGDPGCCGGRA